jgi:hypothetical protein
MPHIIKFLREMESFERRFEGDYKCVTAPLDKDRSRLCFLKTYAVIFR